MTNARQQLVSMAGTLPGSRIGDVVPPQLAESARPLDLSMRSEVYGKLFVRQTPSGAVSDSGFANLRLAAVAAFAATAVAAGLMLLRQRRARRNGD